MSKKILFVVVFLVVASFVLAQADVKEEVLGGLTKLILIQCFLATADSYRIRGSAHLRTANTTLLTLSCT